MDKTTWEKFINHQTDDLTKLKPNIAASWQVCRQSCIDPHQRKSDQINFQHRKRFNQQEQDLISLAQKEFNNLQTIVLSEYDPLLVLALADGTIIARFGSSTVQKQADEIGFQIGHIWTNQAVGTNAIGLALTTQKTATVSRYEHFVALSQKWSCFADLIKDENNQLQGVIDVSFYDDYPTQAGLQLIKNLAKNISLRVMQANVLSQKAILDFATFYQGQPALICDLQRRLIKKPEQLAYFAELNLGQILPTTLDTVKSPIPITHQKRQIGWLYEVKPHFELDSNFYYTGIRTKSFTYQHFLQQVQQAAHSLVPVHLTGESGSGKEIIAQTLHYNSPYKNGPLVCVNCGAISDDLLQSELFGYAPGAFTGASPKGFQGKLMQANRGTLFLDEINSMSPKMQSALLRVLEDNWVTPIGSDKRHKTHFRLISASNEDLRELARKGKFRTDLFYRIYVCALVVPPLRDHLEDLEPLLQEFCHQNNWQFDWQKRLLKVAQTYDWPGNIREFNNFLERLYLYFSQQSPTNQQIYETLQSGSLTITPRQTNTVLNNNESKEITMTLQKHHYHLTQTAQALGISRSTLYRKMKKYNLSIGH